MITLYEYPLSGHSHKVRLMLSLLELDYQPVNVDLLKGAQREQNFLNLNPLGQVPVLVEDTNEGKIVIRDSNAILVYLAKKYGPEWCPNNPKASAHIQEWLTTSAKEIFAGPGSARLVAVFGANFDHLGLIKQSHELLEKIDKHLESRDWLALSLPTIADISAYPYIAHAPEGDVSLESYSNIGRWLRNVENLPGFIPMQAADVKSVA